MSEVPLYMSAGPRESFAPLVSAIARFGEFSLAELGPYGGWGVHSTQRVLLAWRETLIHTNTCRAMYPPPPPQRLRPSRT